MLPIQKIWVKGNEKKNNYWKYSGMYISRYTTSIIKEEQVQE